LVLRDVSFAVVVASQVQGVAEKGAQAAGNWLGKAATPLVGPLADGIINGMMTLRIGYLARARCRAFRAFTQASVANYLQEAMQEVARQATGLVGDLVKNVGTPVLKLPVEAGKKLLEWVGDWVGGWFGRGGVAGAQP
jgi:hypothetical protein